MKKITQEEFDAIPVVDNVKQCSSFTDYSLICSFGEGCSFKTLSITLLNASMGDVSDELCLELMRRDAAFHPNPSSFDRWANNGGACPYTGVNVVRAFDFIQKKELWEPGKPTMTDYELLIKIMKFKNWTVAE